MGVYKLKLVRQYNNMMNKEQKLYIDDMTNQFENSKAVAVTIIKD